MHRHQAAVKLLYTEQATSMLLASYTAYSGINSISNRDGKVNGNSN